MKSKLRCPSTATTSTVKFFAVEVDGEVRGVLTKQQAKRERKRIGDLWNVVMRPASIEEQHKYIKENKTAQASQGLLFDPKPGLRG